MDNHTHTQPAHTHGYNSVGNEANNGYHASGPHYGFLGRTTSSAGGENTGSSAPYTSYSSDHNHSASVSCGNAGGGAAFNILPPYLRVNIWKRLT